MDYLEMGVCVNINNKIYVFFFVFYMGCEGDDYCKKKKFIICFKCGVCNFLNVNYFYIYMNYWCVKCYWCKVGVIKVVCFGKF